MTLGTALNATLLLLVAACGLGGAALFGLGWAARRFPPVPSCPDAEGTE